MSDRIRVVVADDSPFVCRLLTSYLQASPGIEVVGTALNGARAVQLVEQLRPDVATLDVEMPAMDGLEALERIMVATPTPVVMISGVSGRAADRTLKALEMGAVDFVLKYAPDSVVDPVTLHREIVAKVRSAAGIRVIRSLGRKRGWPAPVTAPPPAEPVAAAGLAPEGVAVGGRLLDAGVVVVGASTGGPLAVKELLMNLPAEFPAAILVVQHIPASFTPVLAAQLHRQVAVTVREAREGDRLEAGTALVAPGGFHLLITADSRVELRRGPEICGHCPSIDVTMQAVSQVYGSRTRGVVLTGMGNDGSNGMVSVHSRGGRTYAQDAATCVVNGMPQRAVDKGVVNYVAPPWQIGRQLTQELGGERRRKVC